MAVRDAPELVSSVRRLGPLLVALVLLAVLLDLGRRLVTGALPVSTLATFLWDGLVFGMAVGLAGIGLAMTYSILQFANFAHGDYITAGAFTGWLAAFVVAGVGSFGLDALVLVSDTVPTGELGINVFATPLAILAGLVAASHSCWGHIFSCGTRNSGPRCGRWLTIGTSRW